jgi:hypothetical protein
MKKAISPAIHVISNSLTVIQFWVTLSLLYVAYKMGRNHMATVNNNHTHTTITPNNAIKPKAPVPVVKAKEEVKAK